MSRIADKNQRRFAYAMTMPVVIVLLALMIFPLIFLVTMSFQTSQQGLGNMEFVGFQNYVRVFSSEVMWIALRNTVVFVISSVALTLTIGMAVALLLSQISFGSRFFQTLFVLPLAVAPVVSGLTWSMAFNPDLGVVNYLLQSIGLPTSGWATERGSALATVILVDSWYWTPFPFLIFYAGLKMLPTEYYEAAQMDGASWLRQTASLTLPLLKSLILIAFLFRTMDAIRTFDIIYTMTGGGPGRATENLVLRAYFEGLQYFNIEIGATIGVLLLVVTIIGTRLLLRLLPR